MTDLYETVHSEQEKKARIIIDRVYDAFLEIDFDNVIIDWNTRAEIIFGWTREQVIGKMFADVIIPARYREAQRNHLTQFRSEAMVRSTLSNKQIEIFALRHDGQEFPAEMTVFPVPSGNSVNLGVFIRDISELKTAKPVLNESEENFRLLLSSVTDYAIIMLDPQGMVTTWNEGAQRISGYTANEIIGKHFSQFYTYEDKAIDTPKRVLETAVKYGRYEEDGQCIRKDGSQFWANTVITPIYGQGGKLAGFAKVTRDISERKAADRNFRRLLELAPDAMVIVNQQGNIVLVNSQTENIFGFDRKELIGQTVEKLIPDRSKFLAQRHMRSMSTGLELYALHKDGTEFPVEISLSPLETEEGLLVSSAIRDITERKRLEYDLLKQKELFQIILDSLADGVIVADKDGRFLVVNRAAQQMTGIDYTEVPIDKWSEQYGLYEADAVTLYQPQNLPLVRAMQGQTLIEVEMFIRNSHVPKGAWLNVNGAPMVIGNGAGTVGVIVFRDVSKHKQTEQKNAQLAAIVESTDDAVIGSNLDGTIISWNDAATRMFGYSQDEAIGQLNLIIIPVTLLTEETAVFKGVMTGKGRTEHHETVRRAKDGTLLPVSLTVSPIRDKTGTIIGMSKIIRDITDRKQAEQAQLLLAEELKRSNAELQQFASVASHDLQEPLRGVAGCLEIIEETYKGKLDDKADKLIRHAVDGASRMHALIDDLLSLSRVTTNEMTIQPADLSAVLNCALENLELPIKESLAVITHDDLPVLAADSTHLVQLFQNLLSNAIKFRSDSPLKVHIGAKCEDGHWLFFVRDNGIGFEQVYTDRIFLPFKRLHSKDQYPGTGIGLAICKRILERHGGRLWAESEYGKGATFYFTIGDPKGNHD